VPHRLAIALELTLRERRWRMHEITDRQLMAFKAFMAELPHGKDAELVLLKGHILIEEQIRLLINRRVRNPAALCDANARLDCHQAICLARSFFPPDFQPEVWRAVTKLNKMRNDITHAIVPRKILDDRISAWMERFPSGFIDFTDRALRFEVTLWSLFDAVSELVTRRALKSCRCPLVSPMTKQKW
jgi:hypothetical protein